MYLLVRIHSNHSFLLLTLVFSRTIPFVAQRERGNDLSNSSDFSSSFVYFSWGFSCIFSLALLRSVFFIILPTKAAHALCYDFVSMYFFVCFFLFTFSFLVLLVKYICKYVYYIYIYICIFIYELDALFSIPFISTPRSIRCIIYFFSSTTHYPLCPTTIGSSQKTMHNTRLHSHATRTLRTLEDETLFHIGSLIEAKVETFSFDSLWG